MTAIFANDADYAKAMIAKGWQVITIGTEARWISASALAARRVIDGGEPEASADAPKGGIDAGILTILPSGRPGGRLLGGRGKSRGRLRRRDRHLGDV